MVLQNIPIIYTHPVYQYSKTSVMYFLLSLLRIKGVCMFRALLAHFQEVLHKRHLVYCKHARIIPSVVCVAPPEVDQVMLETCRGP
jgi:hypothetical protein